MGTSLIFKLAIFEQQDKSFHKGYHIMWAQQTLRCFVYIIASPIGNLSGKACLHFKDHNTEFQRDVTCPKPHT